MYNFSVEISDKIAPLFADKLEKASTLGVNNIEIWDVIDGTPIYKATGEQIEKIRDALVDSGKRIVLLTTKLDAGDSVNLNLLFRRALALNVKGIKIAPKESDDLTIVTKLSKAYGIPLLVENAAQSWIKDENVMHELVKNNENLSLIFNPFEFVKTQRHPFFHVYYSSKIKKRISFLRITDGLYTIHEPIMLHRGCAEVKELASIMLSRSFDGYFSFTPYLNDMTFEQYQECMRIFKTDLKEM